MSTVEELREKYQRRVCGRCGWNVHEMPNGKWKHAVPGRGQACGDEPLVKTYEEHTRFIEAVVAEVDRDFDARWDAMVRGFTLWERSGCPQR